MFDQRNFGRAEGEAEAVVFAVLDEAVVAERPEAVAELLDIVDDERADRGDVERAEASAWRTLTGPLKL